MSDGLNLFRLDDLWWVECWVGQTAEFAVWDRVRIMIVQLLCVRIQFKNQFMCAHDLLNSYIAHILLTKCGFQGLKSYNLSTLNRLKVWKGSKFNARCPRDLYRCACTFGAKNFFCAQFAKLAVGFYEETHGTWCYSGVIRSCSCKLQLGIHIIFLQLLLELLWVLAVVWDAITNEVQSTIKYAENKHYVEICWPSMHRWSFNMSCRSLLCV